MRSVQRINRKSIIRRISKILGTTEEQTIKMLNFIQKILEIFLHNYNMPMVPMEMYALAEVWCNHLEKSERPIDKKELYKIFPGFESSIEAIILKYQKEE